jgi:hypothetical protein
MLVVVLAVPIDFHIGLQQWKKKNDMRSNVASDPMLVVPIGS